MRNLRPLLVLLFLFVFSQFSLFPGISSSQTFPDSTADVVIGQSNFTTGTSGTTQTTFNRATGMALDTTVSPPILYIADRDNHRILGYYNYLFIQTGAPADFVIGQSDYVTGTSGLSSTEFNQPQGIAVDPNGNLWVADNTNNRVLVFISPTTTDYTADYVFGQGGSFTTGTQNNGGISDSSLYLPMNIAFDNQNRAYICDTYNHRILIFNDPLNTDRKADYVLGQSDFTTGSSSTTDSTLNMPYNCVILPNGDLYVADYSNHRILKFIDPINTDRKADQVFGQAGNYTTATANNPSLNEESLNYPINIAVDEFGILYVSDATNHRVLAYNTPLDTTADYVYGQGGSYTTNTSSTTATGLYSPNGILTDKYGNILIADVNNHRVAKFLKTSNAVFYTSETELNFGTINTGTTDTLDFMILNSGMDTLFVDSLRIQSTNGLTGNSFTIVEMTDTITASPPDTMFINVSFNPAAETSYLDSLVIYHRKRSGSATEIMTIALTGDGQETLLTGGWPPPDSTADVVIGQTDFVTGTSGLTQTKFNNASFVALDTAVSPPILYVSDVNNHRILGYYNYPFLQNGAAADFVIGQTDFTSNTTGVTDSKFNTQYGIAVDNDRNLWVADNVNNRVLVFISPTTTDFTADYVFGQAGSFTSNTANLGGVSDSSLNRPCYVTFDNQDRVYICEGFNNRILIFNDPLNTDLAADYVIGQSDFISNGSSCTDSTLYSPTAIAVAENGDLFVADYGNHRVLKFNDPINTDKKADQVFGQGGNFTTNTLNNPSLNAESLNNPVNVYMDKFGQLYISDSSFALENLA